MEITYDTGAQVILQGPVTYEVESNGGYLSVGKLTGKLEKKAEGGRGKAEEDANHKSEIRNQKSPFPLPPSPFVVRTPTATVTDLGTEFGVEVDERGVSEAHVFSGTIVVGSVPIQGEVVSSRTLSAGTAVRIESGRMVLIAKPAGVARFVHLVPRPQPRVKFLGPLPYQSFENRGYAEHQSLQHGRGRTVWAAGGRQGPAALDRTGWTVFLP